jgi:hypothetical protein
VKKIFLFLAPMLIMTIAYGCSKDHQAPTFSKYEGFLKKPQNIIATFSKSKDEFNLTWDMSDTNSVEMYFVAWSDSNVFDLGKQGDEYTNSLKLSYTLNATRVLKSMGYTAPKDSFIVYFTVSAVYNNIQFKEFSGPRSAVDSALVYRK